MQLEWKLETRMRTDVGMQNEKASERICARPAEQRLEAGKNDTCPSSPQSQAPGPYYLSVVPSLQAPGRHLNQKSIDALNLTKRDCSTDVGTSHCPLGLAAEMGMNAWL